MNLSNKKVSLFDIPIDNLTMQETLGIVGNAIADGRQIHHTVVNAGKVVAMQKDAQLRESVVSADLINADGMAIVWASKLVGRPLVERVTGIDLMEQLVAKAKDKGWKIYLLGAREEIVSKVAGIYSDRYSPDIIAGYRNGYFKPEEEAAIAREIADSGANILFVAITSPKKENFLYKHREQLSSVSFIMGVGGSFDVVGGFVKRAPLWMQKTGLEWFYRFLQEPGRMWRRYLVGNTKFILLSIKELFKKSN